MNKEQLKKTVGQIVTLVPVACRLDQNGTELEIVGEDPWEARSATADGIMIYNPRTQHQFELRDDHVHKYTSETARNGVKRGILMLTVQPFIIGNEVRVLPNLKAGDRVAPNLAQLGIRKPRPQSPAKPTSMITLTPQPTAADRAMALARRQRFAEETEQLAMQSAEPFYDACAQLFDAVTASLRAIAAETGWKLVADDVRGVGKYPVYIARFGNTTLQLVGKDVALNTSRGSYLLLRVFKGVLVTPEEERKRMMSFDNPVELSRLRIELTRDPDFGWGFKFAGTPGSIADTAGLILAKFMEAKAREAPR